VSIIALSETEMRVELDQSCWAEVKDTPWDTAAFGVKTCEITSIHSPPERLTNLLGALVARIDLNGVGLSYTRRDADAREEVAAFQSVGFRFVECTTRVQLRRAHKFVHDPRITRRALPLRIASIEDAEALEKISAESFDYGRFREDPRIPMHLLHRRQSLWIQDLLQSDARIIVAESGTGIASFMAFTIRDDAAELILGGSRRGSGHLSFPFWTSIISMLAGQGTTTISANISAANLGIVNLYARLGFEAIHHKVGLHRLVASLTAG
jgi:hypothetical protein